MRSAAVLGLLVLAGCKPAEQAPAEPSPTPAAAETATTVDLRGSPSDPPAPPPAPPPPPTLTPKLDFQALGTEPFWSIVARGRTLTYSSPEKLKGTAFAATITHDGNRQIHRGKLDGKPVVLTIEFGTCSDGMSDTVYPYKASFTWGERTEQGCARLK